MPPPRANYSAPMRGRILVNGNMGSVADLVARARPWLFHRGRAPRVLLVTAAWGEDEYQEGHVKEALNAAGVPSDWRDGADRGIANLCAWHVWQAWLARNHAVAAVDAELREVEEATRRFYVEKTSFHAHRVRRAVAFARARLDGFRLGALPVHERDSLRPEATMSGRELLGRALARELVHDVADLVQNDRRMLEALDEAEEMLPARTGLRLDPTWQRDRATLEGRVLDADVIFLFGGDPAQLLAPLRFFDLRPALREALRRGALLVSVSAGSLVLCERMIVYDDFSPDPARREFRLFDRGLGLMGGLQVLPHCMDRIHTDDADNLAYLARRFATHVCAGLNEESFLLVDLAEGTATSVGEHDGVYVFGPDGVKWRYGKGERVPLA